MDDARHAQPKRQEVVKEAGRQPEQPVPDRSPAQVCCGDAGDGGLLAEQHLKPYFRIALCAAAPRWVLSFSSSATAGWRDLTLPFLDLGGQAFDLLPLRQAQRLGLPAPQLFGVGGPATHGLSPGHWAWEMLGSGEVRTVRQRIEGALRDPLHGIPAQVELVHRGWAQNMALLAIAQQETPRAATGEVASMRIRVCISQGRPVAIFTALDAGDRWLAENMASVDIVFALEDGQPTIKPVSQPMPSYLTRQQPLDSHVPKKGNGQRPAV